MGIDDKTMLRLLKLGVMDFAGMDISKMAGDDARLFAMKGSLYLKLGKKDLARTSWEKALSLDPKDAAVAEALRHIKEE